MGLGEIYKRASLSHRIVFVIAIAATITGFYYLNKLYTGTGHLGWAILQSAFLWFLLIFLIILVDSNESIKHELKEVVREQVKETKLMKKIANEQLQEIKLLRKAMAPKKRRKK